MNATLNIHNITELVIRHADRAKTEPRLFQLYASLVRHLHDFVREVRLSESELQRGREFINRVTQPSAQMPAGELHMLTDLLGASELVELLADEGRGEATERNLEGPLYVANPPWRQQGAALGVDASGDPLTVGGCVLDDRGRPIAAAIVDVWQAASNGLYDIQDSAQPAGNFRGRFATDSDGRYSFATVVPPGYRVPDAGPSGEMLRQLGRHPWRAGHIHFKLSAADHEPLTTQLFIDRDPYLGSDTTFAVRSAVLALRPRSDAPGFAAEFDFVLRSRSAMNGRRKAPLDGRRAAGAR
jgi:hydroxyquinol 1,2-dioxygenase